ncbi:hypothetical protein JOC78_001392 [Bacillus ectoiniformans]|uniref:stalk domain-containing protein n=1 Tax=Bacillus ectoiniformans TaxID=1494429 RepID=UPI00195A5DFC|nr:hypothetical protein [Bacillus ectoiniformans]MBM7648450.1 hypothetical protein [Bacillus ectoiniformans]
MKKPKEDTMKGIIIGAILTAGIGSGVTYAGTVIDQYKTPRGNIATVEEEHIHKNRLDVTVNGQPVESHTWYHNDEKTFVKLRDIAEMLGAEVNYNPQTMSADIFTADAPAVTVDLTEYAPPEMSVKYFKGEGNEYASYTESVMSVKNGLLETYIDNGGTRALSIFDISQNELANVYHKTEVYDQGTVDLSKLDRYKNREALLQSPLRPGQEINGWKITKTNAEIQLPYGIVDHVIVKEKQITQKDGSLIIMKEYWAKGLGLVKDEYIDIGSNFTVTSELEKIEPYK